MQMNLTRRGEWELANGDRSAPKTLERARRELIKRGDAEGLGSLLEVARRLDDDGRLTYAVEQNLKFLARQTAVASSRASARSSSATGFGINLWSVAALVAAAIGLSDVFHLGFTGVALASIPGTALAALGVRSVRSRHQRQWLAWTALGLNTWLFFLAGFIYSSLGWFFERGWLPVP